MVSTKKVLFISAHGDPLTSAGDLQAGGQNVYVRELARALCSLGWKVDVLTCHDDPGKPVFEAEGNFRVFRFSTGGRPAFIPKDELPRFLPGLFPRFFSLAQKNRYKLIHTHYWMSGWLGINLARKLALPLVHTSHSLGIVKKKAGSAVMKERMEVERLVLAHADAVITTTRQEQDIVRSFIPATTPGSRVRVIPAGICTKVFNSYGRSPEQPPFLLFVGRPDKNKGLDLLLGAWEELSERPDLYIVGRHRQVKKSGLHFTGPLHHTALAAMYKRAAVTVVPSLYESFGLVALEAMACGCPVVASSTGGLKEVVENGQTGLTFPPGNVQALKDGLVKLLRDPPLAERMGLTGAKRAAAYDWRLIAEKMGALYEEVCLRTITGKLG